MLQSGDLKPRSRNRADATAIKEMVMGQLQRWLGRLLAPHFKQLRDDWAAAYKAEQDRKARRAIAIEFSEDLVNQCREWSQPLQIRFVRTTTGWNMEVRTLSSQHEAAIAQRVAYQQEAASRAARQ